MDKIEKKGSATQVMFFKLLVVLLIFSINRVLFLSFNFSYFYNGENGWPITLALLWGLRFDLSAIALINAPFIALSLLPLPFRENRIYQRFINSFYFLPNIIAFMVDFGDIAYFRFTGKRTTSDIFSFLQEDNIISLIPQFFRDYWYLFILFAAVTTLFIWLSLRLKVRKPAAPKHQILWFVRQVVILLITLASLVVVIRGGFQLRPINMMSAAKHTSNQLISITLNTPFCLIRTYSKSGVENIEYFTEGEADKLFSPWHTFSDKNWLKQKNIVIIILESFSREHSGLHGYPNEKNYLGFMPFLDSLALHGEYVRCFANGKRSMVGIPAILSGFPSLMNGEFLNSPYATNPINSIAKIGKTRGYTSAFFHGGTDGSLGFDNYSAMAGFDYYFGRKRYNNDADYDGKWGIFDEPFLQYMAQILDTLPEPFVTSVFTLSSHHPYTIPPTHIGQFRKGELQIQECVMYSDFALQQFFETAKKMPWFKNTLFIITADHASEGLSSYYKNPIGQFEIPLLFYSPSDTLPPITKAFGQQCDILPTVADLFGIQKPLFALGSSLYDTTSAPFSLTYRNGFYQMIKGDFVLQMSDGIGKSLYIRSEDSLLQHNILLQNSTINEEITAFTKAVIQQYNAALIYNKMIDYEE